MSLGGAAVPDRQILADEGAGAERLQLRAVRAAELHRQLDRADLEGRLPVEVRPAHVDARAEADRDRDLAEDPGVDRDAGGDARVDVDLVVERVEVDDAVGAELDLGPGRPEVC